MWPLVFALETLEKSIFEIELNQTTIFNNIFKLIKSIDITDTNIQPIQQNQDITSFSSIIQKLYQLFLNNDYQIMSDKKELYFHKNDILICFTKHKKSKTELIFPIKKDLLTINFKYEIFRKNEIIIELKDNNLLFDFILSKIQ